MYQPLSNNLARLECGCGSGGERAVAKLDFLHFIVKPKHKPQTHWGGTETCMQL